MTSPPGNINSNSNNFVVVRRNQGAQDNRPRVEPTAQELAEFVIPILGSHHQRLNLHAGITGNLSGSVSSLTRLAAMQDRDIAQMQEVSTELFDQVLPHIAVRIHTLEQHFVQQNAEIRRLRDLPCNRLQRTVTNWCIYL